MNWRLPELLTRRRTWSTGTLDPGAFVVRASPTLATPSATGMCSGAYGGTFFIGEKYGQMRDFSELSMRVAMFNPGTLSAGLGFVFNYRQTFGGITSYVAIFRGRAGGPELCAGVYKMTNGVPSAITGGSATITAIPGFDNALNPALATTPLASRVYAKIGVTKTGGLIQLWINDPTNIVVSVTDPSPLGAGAVGIAAIAPNSVVFDDFMVSETPTCTDGVLNGQETGIDCGGFSDVACPPCPASNTFLHSFATDGLNGWWRETHGTASGVHYPAYAADGVQWTTNTGLTWPGSSGLNCAIWVNGWIYVAAKWPTSTDFTADWTVYPDDNDWIGIAWRYVDHNNYYFFTTRQEAVAEGHSFAIHRRRNGVNTVVYVQANMYPQTYNPKANVNFRVTMTGARIQVFTDFPTPNTLIADVTDPDPMIAPGYVGFTGGNQDPMKTIQFQYTPTSWRPNPSPSLPSELVLSAGARSAVSFYGQALNMVPQPLGSVNIFRDGANSRGNNLGHSPFLASTASRPGVIGNLSPLGQALWFGGNQHLWATTRHDFEPAITGMTFFLAFVPLATVAPGAAGVVLAKGLRDRPTSLGASGWRLQMRAGTDRTFTGVQPSDTILQFTAVAGSRSSDSTADLATVIPLNRPSVVAIRVSPTTLSGALDSRRFTVQAQLNRINFTDSADMFYTGIVSSGYDGMLSMGATDQLTDPSTMGVLELVAFEGALSDADFNAVNDYMVNKYAPTVTTCPDIISGQPQWTVVGGNCGPNAPEGSTCSLDCAAPAVRTAGNAATPLVCRAGRWVGTAPRCDTFCPAITAVGAGENGCRRTVYTQTWPAVGPLGLNASIARRSFNVVPFATDSWRVNTAGRLSVRPFAGYIFEDPVQLLISEPVWETVTDRLAIQQTVTIPASPSTPQTITLLPRFVDQLNFYAIDIRFQSTGRSMAFRRVRGGASTELCALRDSAIAVSSLASYSFESIFELEAAGTGNVRVLRDGIVWCSVVEPSSSYMASGTAGYAVSGAANFAPVDFGTLSVQRFPRSCNDGCVGVVAGGVCSLPCNPGSSQRGDIDRVCQPDGNFSGVPLTCDDGVPQLTDFSTSLPEHSSVGTNVGDRIRAVFVNGNSGDGTIVFQIVGGDPNGAFSMLSCDGQIQVAKPELLDFERLNAGSAATFSLRIRAFVAGTNPVAESFATATVTVTDTNDAPTVTTSTCNVAENSQVGATVCLLAAVDPDGGNAASWSLVFEEAPGLFALSNGGILSVNRAALDFEGKSSYRLVVRAADVNDASIFSTATVIISLTDVAEAPVIDPSVA